MIDSKEKLQKLSEEYKKKSDDKKGLKILVSLGTCGIAAGTTPILDAINSAKADDVEVVEVGCMGLCHSEPTIEVIDTNSGDAVIYGNVKPEHAEVILASGAKPAEGLDELKRTWYYPEIEDNKDGVMQARIVLRNSGRINPENFDAYIENDGYSALAKTLTELTPQEVIDTMSKSGLRGRGGGGFPTGTKWGFASAQKVAQKYIICNADEGDPGAFMDRAVLEGDPHTVLEAMTIGGYAIGANMGIIYIRAEYPLAIKRLEIAIKQATENGLLGKKIFGTDFNFNIELRYGAGAFVCGEETALIESIEGKRGMPMYKPPFPAIEGLWGKPTIVNNVETYANICAIIRKGADWFKGIGTEGSPGTKVFALAGKISKVGLIEVPMGTTLKDIIYDIGGGIAYGKKFKAVQTGGPSGGCIPKSQIDVKIDYDSLIKLGSMMGSGGMIVLDEDDCMVDVARFFLEFTCDESCGKCAPCRIGGRQMYKLLTKITKGNGTESDIVLLKDLAYTIKSTSLCGLGQTSPNPVLATLNWFEDEYKQHVTDKKCTAGKCSDLVTYTVDKDNCIGCTVCARNCPVKCISGDKKVVHEINQKDCIRCGACFDVCKFNAINKS